MCEGLVMYEPKRPGLLAIEAYFGMPFKNVINKLHWKEKRTLRTLSNECGISRDTFQRYAKRFGLKVMSHREAAFNKKGGKGDSHWAWGLRKENSAWAKASSDRMTDRNPCSQKDILTKKQASTAETYRKNPLPQEKKFAKILNANRVEYKDQYLIGTYIIDFFIPSLKLCIEIDSTFKWGKDRQNSASKKDAYLSKFGFKILRINKAYLTNKSYILDILKTNNIVSH